MKFTEEQQIVLQAAITTWGEYEQECMAVGECGEFIALQGKKVQGRATPEDWISEIADVTIMMEQLARMHGYEAVQEMVNYKLARLKTRLEKHGCQFD